jgi:hypothetical protein
MLESGLGAFAERSRLERLWASPMVCEVVNFPDDGEMLAFPTT